MGQLELTCSYKLLQPNKTSFRDKSSYSAVTGKMFVNRRYKP